MLSYCLKCKKHAESIDPKVSATSNDKTMVLSKCAICGSKKSKFIKKQKAKGLLSNLVKQIAKDPKYYGSQRGLASMVKNFLTKRLQTVVSSLYLKMSN